jgi:3-isopropylmalate dehydratase small subunit
MINIIQGRVWKFGDSVDTDVISPSGDRGERLRETTMAALRPEFPKEVKPGDILVAGRNFGCGSHRETANTILRDIGVGAIAAESIARIFLRVSISLAYPAFVAKGISGIVNDGDQLKIDYEQGMVLNLNTGASVPLTKYPPSVEKIFNAGGLLPLLKKRYEQEILGI